MFVLCSYCRYNELAGITNYLELLPIIKQFDKLVNLTMLTRSMLDVVLLIFFKTFYISLFTNIFLCTAFFDGMPSLKSKLKFIK